MTQSSTTRGAVISVGEIIYALPTKVPGGPKEGFTGYSWGMRSKTGAVIGGVVLSRRKGCRTEEREPSGRKDIAVSQMHTERSLTLKGIKGHPLNKRKRGILGKHEEKGGRHLCRWGKKNSTMTTFENNRNTVSNAKGESGRLIREKGGGRV